MDSSPQQPDSIFWVALGATVIRWYDRKGLHRLHPDLLAYVQQSIRAYRMTDQHSRPGLSDPETEIANALEQASLKALGSKPEGEDEIAAELGESSRKAILGSAKKRVSYGALGV